MGSFEINNNGNIKEALISKLNKVKSEDKSINIDTEATRIMQDLKEKGNSSITINGKQYGFQLSEKTNTVQKKEVYSSSVGSGKNIGEYNTNKAGQVDSKSAKNVSYELTMSKLKDLYANNPTLDKAGLKKAIDGKGEVATGKSRGVTYFVGKKDTPDGPELYVRIEKDPKVDVSDNAITQHARNLIRHVVRDIYEKPDVGYEKMNEYINASTLDSALGPEFKTNAKCVFDSALAEKISDESIKAKVLTLKNPTSADDIKVILNSIPDSSPTKQEVLNCFTLVDQSMQMSNDSTHVMSLKFSKIEHPGSGDYPDYSTIGNFGKKLDGYFVAINPGEIYENSSGATTTVRDTYRSVANKIIGNNQIENQKIAIENSVPETIKRMTESKRMPSDMAFVKSIKLSDSDLSKISAKYNIPKETIKSALINKELIDKDGNVLSPIARESDGRIAENKQVREKLGSISKNKEIQSALYEALANADNELNKSGRTAMAMLDAAMEAVEDAKNKLGHERVSGVSFELSGTGLVVKFSTNDSSNKLYNHKMLINVEYDQTSGKVNQQKAKIILDGENTKDFTTAYFNRCADLYKNSAIVTKYK